VKSHLFHRLLLGDRPCECEHHDPTHEGNEQIHLLARPAMFRHRPFLFVFLCLLTLCWAVGLPFLAAWWIWRRCTLLIVTSHRTIYQYGVFSRHFAEIPTGAAVNITVYQDLIDRLLKVGYVRIATAGTSDYEIQIPGMPDPYKIKGIVDKLNGSLNLRRIGRMAPQPAAKDATT
jgi:membrane protein YdbS with pleckstrin-like domain